MKHNRRNITEETSQEEGAYFMEEKAKVQSAKRLLRKKHLDLRDALSQEERLTKSHAIMEAVVSSYDFLQAKRVLVYASFGSEVLTSGIAKYAFLLGKKVYCPKVLADGEMEFYEIPAYHEDYLKPGYHGIPEPDATERTKFIPNGEPSILIMPGVCFDEKGHRIGYGKGFYDRYTARIFCGIKMAIAYDNQVQSKEELPTDETDALYDLLVTESRTVCLIDEEESFANNRK